MNRILIIDPLCDKEYDSENIEEETEQLKIYITMLLNGLVERDNNLFIYFAQKNRNIKKKIGNINYISIEDSKKIYENELKCIIVMHSLLVNLEYSNMYENTTVYLWLFEFAQKTLLSITPQDKFDEFFNPVIACSLWQANNIAQFLDKKNVNTEIIILPFFVTLFINDVKEYPVDILQNDKRDKNKLLYVNENYKGLERTIEVFKKIRKYNPDLVLYVITHNKNEKKEKDENNIIYLGSLKRNDILVHMRKSLCLFHVNDMYPESFGFSHITANLLRIPVITYNNGALKENLELENKQVINCRSPYITIKRIEYLQNNEILEDINRSNNYSKQNVVDLWFDFLGI